MPSVFTQIIMGELPGRFVWRDERCVAILTINPLTPGHTLVIPRQEVDNWLDLEPELLAHLSEVSQKLGWAITNGFHPRRVAVIIAGLEVPHVHLHLVPFDEMRELDFSLVKQHPEPAELDEAAEVIRASLRSLGMGQFAD